MRDESDERDADAGGPPADDPIIAELRATRAALLAAAGGDLAEYARRLRAAQAESARSGHPVVSLPPQRVADGAESAA